MITPDSDESRTLTWDQLVAEQREKADAADRGAHWTPIQHLAPNAGDAEPVQGPAAPTPADFGDLINAGDDAGLAAATAADRADAGDDPDGGDDW